MTGTPGLFGVTVSTGVQAFYGNSANTAAAYDNAYSSINTLFGYSAKATKIFFNPSEYPATVAGMGSSSSHPVQQKFQAALDQGARIYLCYKPGGKTDAGVDTVTGANPAVINLSTTQRTSLVNSVTGLAAACVSAGTGAVIAGVIFYQECNDAKQHVAATGTNGYVPAVNFYGPNIRALTGAGFLTGTCRLGFAAGSGSSGAWATFFNPGGAQTCPYDFGEVDYYATVWKSGTRLDGFWSIVNTLGIPGGVMEMGNTATGIDLANPTVDMPAYLQYVGGSVAGQLAAGHNTGDCSWFMGQVNTTGSPNIISSSSDYRIPLIKAFIAQVTASASGSVSVVQVSNNIAGVTGNLGLYFGQGGSAAASTPGTTLVAELTTTTGNATNAISAPDSTWTRVSPDTQSGSGTGIARVQIWECAGNPGGLGKPDQTSNVVFTYSATGAVVKGRLYEVSTPAGTVLGVDQVSASSVFSATGQASPASFVVAASAANSHTGGIAIGVICATFSTTPAGQAWTPAPSGWTTDGTLNNLPGTYVMFHQAGLAAGTTSATYPTSFSSGVMACWAGALVTFYTIPASLSVTTATIPGGATGTAYSQALAASGGQLPYTWSLASGLPLPAGLTLSSAGVLSGTPTVPGTYTFTVQVADALMHTATAVFTITITGTAPTLTTASLPDANVGNAYSQALAATGGTSPYTFTIDSGALPAGLSLTGAGVVSGTPTTAATSVFNVRVTDSLGAFGVSTLSINTLVFLTVQEGPLADAEAAIAYSASLAAIGGSEPFTWVINSGVLPTGLSLDAPTGLITGTPSGATGVYTLTVQVTDTVGNVDTGVVTITLQPAPVVTSVVLDNGIAGVLYLFVLQAAGGLRPYTWAVTAGIVPDGLALGTDGTLTGTPTTAGTTSFTARVTDAGGVTATGVITITISPAPFVPAPGDSLIVAGRFQLLGQEVSDDPACEGAVFSLGRSGGDPEYDLGMPQPAVDVLAALSLDGERPMGRRASNRTMTIPIVIRAPDRDTLAGAREALLSAIDADTFTVEWARQGEATLAFDAFRAAATTYHYSLPADNALVSTLSITFTALPYGRSTELETMSFPPQSAAWPTPAAPVVIDDFSVVVSSTSPGQWYQAAVFAGGGSFSAKWSRQRASCPFYSRALPSAVNAGTRSRVSFWFGLATSIDQYHVWHGGRVQFDITLTDSSGVTERQAATVHCRCSGKQGVPEWTKISVAVPATTLLDLTSITAYSVKAWNTTDPTTRHRVLQADAYLSYFTSSPIVVGVAGVRGAAYDLRGITGSARSPLNVQVQPGTGVIQNVYTKTTSGSATFTVPAGTFQVYLEGTGAGGGGGSGSAGAVTDGGAGGGAGEYAAEPGWAVTPGTVITVNPGAGGAGGPSPGGLGGGAGSGGGDTTITIGGVTVLRAHGGQGGVRGALTSSTGGLGGTGSNATIHNDGGTGGRPQGGWGQRFEGSGGGSSGGPNQAGKDGGVATRSAPNSSQFDPGSGGTAVDGGGPGGSGGGDSAGHSPRRGPGGGGGGGDGEGAGFGGGAGFDGQVRITYGFPAVLPLKELVLHRPGHSASPSYQPLVAVGGGADIPNGVTEYPLISQVPGVPAKFGGRTYTVVAAVSAWHGSAARAVTVTVHQYDGVSQPGPGTPTIGGRETSVSVTRTLAPAAAPRGVFIIDDIPLPPRGLADDQAGSTYTISIQSADTADRFLDVLLLDTEGSTVFLDSPGGYANLWLDSPEPGLGLGLVIGSNGDRDSASSVLDEVTVTGPPLYVEPGDQWLLAYSPSGAPALFASYMPRWYLDRLS